MNALFVSFVQEFKRLWIKDNLTIADFNNTIYKIKDHVKKNPFKFVYE